MMLNGTCKDQARIGLRRVACIAIVLTLFAGGAFAASFADYQGRIQSVREIISDLSALDASTKNIAAFQRERVAVLRKTLPPNETIEWPGGTADVDSRWYHEELDRYDAEADLSKQFVILDRIDDRLEAIIQATAETQTALAGEHSKDEDKRKLAEILTRQEYQKPESDNESLFQKWKREILAWLAKMFPAVDIPSSEPSAGMGSFAVILQVVLYAGLAAGIIFLLYKFGPFLFSKFGDRAKPLKNDRVILGERIADGRSSSDLFSEAEDLAREGHLRLAIRKGYIALLCELSDRKVIGLARHKTNRDYLRDLRTKGELFKNVSGLTGRFERHWYGADESAERDWEEFRSLYHETVRGA